VPLTTAVRERTAQVLGRICPLERETLDRLAFAEPLSPALDDLDLGALEALESDGLIEVGDLGGVRLAHPLHGPVLRAAAGRLRARRLSWTPDAYAPALDAESAALARRIDRDDVRAMPTPVGEWLVAEGGPLPGRYAAVRARFARLRGELREAEAWAREGLRGDPGDASCREELARACAPVDRGGDLDLEALTDPYDAVRLGEDVRIAVGGEVRDVDRVARADAVPVQVDVLQGDPRQPDGAAVRDVAQQLVQQRVARPGPLVPGLP
jgi:hypothetical protein